MVGREDDDGILTLAVGIESIENTKNSAKTGMTEAMPPYWSKSRVWRRS